MNIDLNLPIPVLSNHHILELLGAKLISIKDFDQSRLAPTAYQLSPFVLRFRNEDEEGLGPDENVFSLNSPEGRSLRPGEYAIVSPKEKITLAEGLVADFYPSSWCIDKRLVLTAGRLDAKYDGRLIFGLFNGGTVDVKINAKTQIARVSFGWLGKHNMPDYSSSQLPGAYNHELQELRMQEDVITKAEEALRLQREEILRRRKAISAS